VFAKNAIFELPMTPTNVLNKKRVEKSFLPFSHSWHLPLIIFSVLITYMNTLHHGFVLDDIAVIEENAFVKKGFGGIAQILKTFYWQGFWDSNSGLYRPLSLITFAIEWQLSPNNPLIHHLFNIVYYVIVCCLFYKLLLKWFPDLSSEILLLIVLLFVVHPIHTEVVANIKSRDELLALLFVLLSATTFAAGSTRSIMLSSFYFFLALLSKEGAIMFLPLLLIHIQISRKATLAEVLKSGIPFFVVSALWLLLHQYVIRKGPQVITYSYNDNALLAANSFIEQKGTALGIMARYFVKLVYPYEMAYDYSFSQIPVIGFFSLLSLAGLLMLFGLAYLFLKFYKKDPFISISIAFILFPLLLTSNLFFTIGATAADRFLFVSSIGSCMLMVYLPSKFLKQANHATVLKFGTLIVFLVFIKMTFTRNKAWKDNFTLFETDVNVVKSSARAHYNYGTGLMGLAKENTDQRLLKAKEELQKSLEIDPNYVDALINLGAVHNRLKNYPASIDLYRRAISINKNNKLVYGNMGESFFRNDQPDSAVVYLRKAHSLFNNSSETYNFEGTSLFKLQKYEEACKAFESGIEKDSGSFNLYLNYGNALAMSNRDKEAIKAFEKSYSLKADNNSQALYFIAITYNKMGDSTNANKYYREFKKFNP
jgi:tetratricopeptide (TPR) repeat protein